MRGYLEARSTETRSQWGRLIDHEPMRQSLGPDRADRAAVKAETAGPSPDRQRGMRGRKARRVPSMGAFRGAKRYSRFVRLMKLVLPVVAFGILVAVGIFSAVYEADDELTVTFTESPTLKDDRRMMRPRFTGQTADGRSYQVTAQSAERSEENASEIMLSGLEALMDLEDGSKAVLVADRGLLNLENQMVSVAGDVTFSSDEGYELRTESVLMDMEQRSVEGNEPVSGISPMGTVRANRFSVSEGGRVVRFEGGVVLLVDPAAVEERKDAQSPSALDLKTAPALKGPLKTEGASGLAAQGLRETLP